MEVGPADQDDRVVRIEFFGDEIERIEVVDTLTGEMLGRKHDVAFFPSTHYVQSDEALARAIEGIEAELEQRFEALKHKGKLLEADRLNRRTRYDLELLRETGFCPGIENYSMHLDGRAAGGAAARRSSTTSPRTSCS